MHYGYDDPTRGPAQPPEFAEKPVQLGDVIQHQAAEYPVKRVFLL
jgi:hypothetical protein